MLNIINNVKKFKSLNTSFRDLSHTVHALTFRKLVVWCHIVWTGLLPSTDCQWIGVGFTIRVFGEDLCPSAKQIFFIWILITICSFFFKSPYLSRVSVVKCKIWHSSNYHCVKWSYISICQRFNLNNDKFFRKYWYNKNSVVTALYLTPCWSRSICWHIPNGWRQSSPPQTQRGGHTISYSSQS